MVATRLSKDTTPFEAKTMEFKVIQARPQRNKRCVVGAVRDRALDGAEELSKVMENPEKAPVVTRRRPKEYPPTIEHSSDLAVSMAC